MTTRQEYFNMMWNGLKSQGWQKSINNDGFCAYRGENGRKCAFGWVIPDDKYRPEWDNFSGKFVFDIMNKLDMDTRVDGRFFRDTQICHDSSNSPADMETRFREFAANHSLTIPE